MMKLTKCGFNLLLINVLYLQCLGFAAQNFGDIYTIGIGIGDITGPAGEIEMAGYHQPGGRATSGIHLRQYARTFVIGEKSKNSRILYIVIESLMVSQLLYLEVLKSLANEYDSLYSEKNVCINAIHTHSAAGGFMQFTLYNLNTNGFIQENLLALVTGIMESIRMAHRTLQLGYLFLNKGDLFSASVNRSPSAYLNNPPKERAKYRTNVDTEMVLLKMTNLENKPIGMINWFPVHCVSMNTTNRLISSDNKGYASLLFERLMNNNTIPGKGPFVAAFAQANEGDVSPNTKGPRCIDTGLPCDIDTNSCNGHNLKCVAFGPGRDMFESTEIIGRRQYRKALELFENASNPVSGPVIAIQQFVDMSNIIIHLNETMSATTCKPAMGFSFGAGTTDGPGEDKFRQGTHAISSFWNFMQTYITGPSAELARCHDPKPIVLATGEMTFPQAWQPSIVPTQLLKIGQLFIIAVPAEFTTMSGRRIKDAVKKVLETKCTFTNAEIVTSGLSNTYSSYVTTFEEYQAQRYEGASTIFGPHTLRAYIDQYVKLAKSLCTGKQIDAGPSPPNLLSIQMSLLPKVAFDAPYFGKDFGDVLSDVEDSYTPGSTVYVSFISGHPRNNLQLNGTFLTIEKWDSSTEKWNIIATDANWETKYIWERINNHLINSKATITWTIPEDATPGKYRIGHFGHSKQVYGSIIPYVGKSSTFLIKDV